MEREALRGKVQTVLGLVDGNDTKKPKEIKGKTVNGSAIAI